MNSLIHSTISILKWNAIIFNKRIIWWVHWLNYIHFGNTPNLNTILLIVTNCHNLFIKKGESHREREIRFAWWQHICNNIHNHFYRYAEVYYLRASIIKIKRKLEVECCWFLNKRAFTQNFYSKHCTRRFIYRVQWWQEIHNFDDMCLCIVQRNSWLRLHMGEVQYITYYI